MICVCWFISFTSVAIFLLVSKCSIFPESLYEELRSFVSTIQLSNLFTCFEEAKWFICNLQFPVCRMDKKRKIWIKVPMCRDSCISYSTNPHCEAIKPKIRLLSILKNNCSNLHVNLYAFYCLDLPNVTRSACLSNNYGR